jgi:hypothetical protein
MSGVEIMPESFYFIVYILIIIFLGFITFILSDPFIKYCDKLSRFIAKIIYKKIRWRYIIFIIETFFFLILFLVLGSYQKYLDFITYPFFLPLILIIMRFINIICNDLKTKYINYFSVIDYIRGKMIILRISIIPVLTLSEEITGVIVIISTFWLFLSALIFYHGSEYFYFAIFLYTPLSLALWVYFTPSLKFQPPKISNARKLITYVFLALIAFYGGYNEFSVHFLKSAPLYPEVIGLLFSTLIVNFFALDRVFNLWKSYLDDFGGNNMNKVYVLHHSYSIGAYGQYDETKLIGVYSSRKSAEKTIGQFRILPGFREYPLNCFYIEEYELDQNHWTEGFIKV